MNQSIEVTSLDLMGSEFREKRVNLGLNQTEVAKIIGVNQGAISRWENREHVPRAASIALLAMEHSPMFYNMLLEMSGIE